MAGLFPLVGALFVYLDSTVGRRYAAAPANAIVAGGAVILRPRGGARSFIRYPLGAHAGAAFRPFLSGHGCLGDSGSAL